MTVLIDTNVVLDVLLKRHPFYENSFVISQLANLKRITGYVSASAVTDIFYISAKKLGKKAAKEAIKQLLQIYYPATVTDEDIYHALDLTWDDFEDSVQFTVGEGLSADYIVTRNTQDFSSGHIPVVTPEAFLQIIADTEQ